MQTVYKNRVFRVEKFKVRRKNRTYIQYRVNYKTAVVAILPIIGKDVIIERQYRGALGRYLYEIPAGRAKRVESPIACARRELEEETGYRARSVKPLLVDYANPGLISVKRNYFVATGLAKGRRRLDKDEDIEVRRIRISDAVKLIKLHRIVDSKTITAILFYSLLKSAR